MIKVFNMDYKAECGQLNLNEEWTQSQGWGRCTPWHSPGYVTGLLSQILDSDRLVDTGVSLL